MLWLISGYERCSPVMHTACSCDIEEATRRALLRSPLSPTGFGAGSELLLLSFVRANRRDPLPLRYTYGQHESREGVRTSIRRPNLLYIVVAVVAILVLAAGFMCVAPLFPDLACDPLLGGDGSCDEPDHFNAPSNSTEEKTPIDYERARERVPVIGAGEMTFAERDRLNPSRVMGW